MRSPEIDPERWVIEKLKALYETVDGVKNDKIKRADKKGCKDDVEALWKSVQAEGVAMEKSKNNAPPLDLDMQTLSLGEIPAVLQVLKQDMRNRVTRFDALKLRLEKLAGLVHKAQPDIGFNDLLVAATIESPAPGEVSDEVKNIRALSDYIENYR